MGYKRDFMGVVYTIYNIYNKIYASGITFFTLIYLYVVFKLKTADELDNKCNSVGILIFLLWCICLAMWANVTKYIVE